MTIKVAGSTRAIMPSRFSCHRGISNRDAGQSHVGVGRLVTGVGFRSDSRRATNLQVSLLRFACVVVVGCGARSEIAGVVVPTADASSGSDGATGCSDETIAFDEKGSTALAVDGDTVFWASSDGELERRDGSGDAIIGETATLTSIAYDAQNVYATTEDGDLVSVPRSGGGVTILASNLGLPFALALKGDKFYYINYGAGILAGSVVALPMTATTSPTTIIDQLDTPGGLAVDDTNVYVTAAMANVNQVAVLAPILSAKRDVASTDQTPIVLATATEPTGIAIDQARVYWIDQNFRRRARSSACRRAVAPKRKSRTWEPASRSPSSSTGRAPG